MATHQKIGGYIYRQHIACCRAATAVARRHIQRLLDDHPGPALAAVCLARIGLALGEIDAAITGLEQIAQAQHPIGGTNP